LLIKSCKKITCLIILLISCATPEIDYNELNALIADKKYETAMSKIEVYKGTTANMLENQKLDQLYIAADKGLIFNTLNSRLAKNDSSGIDLELKVILQKIQQKDSLNQRWYYFDYYVSRGQYFSLLGDSAKQVYNLLKAIEYPAKNVQKRTEVFLDLAFHYARIKQFEDAREWLDKALRSFNKDEIEGKLLDVYMAYMNGSYLKADSLLSIVPAENKNFNWQRVTTFFNLYKDSLSLKNRFRLW